ncbi:uncharacterized protein LOC130557692 [Triplophysa rosa]|uniref:uncharacterized protein LOC130557692 n=1 Tax=Triplophysa rosa TaxID=992332 RepID=UPI002545C58A|nr:uncharacterized protein LOC130557692 [Triplophysa rosa]
MAAQLFLVAKGDRNGCKEIHGFSNMSEDEVKQLFSADGDENIQLFSVQLDDISDENPLVLALRLLEQDGSYGPQFMEMELGSHLLNRTDGKGVEMYVQLLDDLTASVMCRGTETTQTSGTKALKDVFYDLSVPLSNQGAIAVELGNILDLDGSPTEEVSRDENDCSDTDSQEEVFYDAVDQLSSYDESDLPEESETEVFYECYEDLSEDQAVDSLVMAAQLFLVAKGDRNGCKEIHGFSNMSEDEVKQLFSADGDENIQLFSVQLDDISDENPLVVSQEHYYNKSHYRLLTDTIQSFINPYLYLAVVEGRQRINAANTGGEADED